MKNKLNLYITLFIATILIIAGIWYQQSNKLVNEIKQNSIEVVDEKGNWSFSIPDRYKHYWLDYQDPNKIVGITLQEYADKGFSPTIEYQEINGYPAGLVIYDIKSDQNISDFIQGVSFKDNEEKGKLDKIKYNNIEIFTFEYFDNRLDMVFTEYYYQKDNYVFEMVKYPAHENPKTINKDKELEEFGKVFSFIDATFTEK